MAHDLRSQIAHVRSSMKKTPLHRAAARGWSPLGSIALWQLACVALRIETFILPAPTEVWASFMKYYGPITMHSLQTLATTLAGFGLAVVFGLFLGLVARRLAHRL